MRKSGEEITKVHEKTLGVMNRSNILIVVMVLQYLPMLKFIKLYASNMYIFLHVSYTPIELFLKNDYIKKRPESCSSLSYRLAG